MRREAMTSRVTTVLIPTILAATIGTICVAAVASAEPAALTSEDSLGRWVSADKTLTLDISRCDKGFCGVAVTDGTCGQTALRMTEKAGAVGQQAGKSREMTGELRLATKSQPYGVRIMLVRDDKDALRLSIGGHTGSFSPMRRSYDYRAVFARVGDATCVPDTKTS
jgi:hypothetical protein